MKKRIKAVIFDMDGVIVDSEPLNDQHMQIHFQRIGIKFTVDYVEQFRGTNSKTVWTKVKQDFNLTESLDELITKSRASYIDFLKNKKDIVPVSGVKELLQRLGHNHFKTAVTSSASPKRIDLLLDVCRIKNLFDIIVSTDDVVHGKPAPDVYLKTAERLKIPPNQCVVIEDAENGVKAAKSAGMKVIGFAGLPYNKQNLSHADKIIFSFDEMSSSLIQAL
ncbi:MAG: phosphatase/phosphohexomutase [uncultured bacterium]|nr:MAG: phosphatase/phosphohexomutase [uncultured bacterium]